MITKLKERRPNPRVCRFFGWSAFFIVAAIVALYVVAGYVDVPKESPLADPNYTLRQLNDVTVPRGTELPPGTITPVNMLNNGEPVVTAGLVLMLTLYTVIMLSGLFAESFTGGLLELAIGQLYIMKTVVGIVVNIPFAYTHLRSMAQPLLENHRLRVIFAYIQLGCEKQNLNMASRLVETWCVSIMIVSYLLAGVIEYLRWKEERDSDWGMTTSRNRPKI